MHIPFHNIPLQYSMRSKWTSSNLVDDFQQRFKDFRKHADTMKLLSDVFEVDPTGAADKYQLELNWHW